MTRLYPGYSDLDFPGRSSPVIRFPIQHVRRQLYLTNYKATLNSPPTHHDYTVLLLSSPSIAQPCVSPRFSLP